MAMVMGTSGMTDSSALMLRRRLGVASLIALVPFIFFIVLNLAGPASRPEWFGLRGLLFHALVILIVGSLTAVLWSKRALSVCVLRKLELVLFGSIALFFSWMQIGNLVAPEFLHWVPAEAPAPVVGQVVTTVVAATWLRWFFLIVLYGVFIPNRWQRTAVVVSAIGILPLGITLVFGLSDPRLRPHIFEPTLTLLVIELAGGAVAIFGSRRIYTLEQESSQYRRLGQYRLLERLGSGGMGEVYLAEHMLLRRPCALKLIHAEFARDSRQLSRFEREVRAMAGLTHWNAVEVFDYGRTEDGTFYYVMEYLPGQNLDTLVTLNGPLPPARVVHLLRQVCLALREAHGVGLLHRDIKPSNIIACHRGGFHDVVKLLDFGLVQDLAGPPSESKLTLQGTILGSPPYMSPEQARGRGELSPVSDIYSLGAVAYFLLTGQPPFVRETVMELLIAHATDAVGPPRLLRPEIPEDLEAVVLRCLSKKPTERYPDAESLEQAFARCACSGEWTEELAAAWWHNHGETVSVRGKAVDAVVTTVMTPQPVS
jgi:serine/threonine-protein kinase